MFREQANPSAHLLARASVRCGRRRRLRRCLVHALANSVSDRWKCERRGPLPSRSTLSVIAHLLYGFGQCSYLPVPVARRNRKVARAVYVFLQVTSVQFSPPGCGHLRRRCGLSRSARRDGAGCILFTSTSALRSSSVTRVEAVVLLDSGGVRSAGRACADSRA